MAEKYSCLVSRVPETPQPNTYDAKEIIESIRADKRFLLRGPILKIRTAFANVMASTGGDQKAAKQAVAEDKSGYRVRCGLVRFRVVEATIPTGCYSIPACYVPILMNWATELLRFAKDS